MSSSSPGSAWSLTVGLLYLFSLFLEDHCNRSAWELVVKLMVEGECVAVKSKARFAYGELGLDELIHPDEDQEYTVIIPVFKS